MRKKNKEITDPQALLAVIDKAEVCRLGMSLNDRPYIVPLNFGYRDQTLYFHCALEGKKLDILKANPHVCFEMDVDVELKPGPHACKWDTEYKSIIGFGVADMITDHEEKKKALDVIMSHYTEPPFEYREHSVEQALIIRVQIHEMTGKQA